MNRALTQKYDMKELRALQLIEQTFTKSIMSDYAVEDEDELPFEIDVLELFNEKDNAKRMTILVGRLAALFSVKLVKQHYVEPHYTSLV
jgi:hypothetical protein